MRCRPGRESLGRESGELSKGHNAGAGRAARNAGPTRERNRRWFSPWFPDHTPDLGRMGRVLLNRRLH